MQKPECGDDHHSSFSEVTSRFGAFVSSSNLFWEVLGCPQQIYRLEWLMSFVGFFFCFNAHNKKVLHSRGTQDLKIDTPVTRQAVGALFWSVMREFFRLDHRWKEGSRCVCVGGGVTSSNMIYTRWDRVAFWVFGFAASQPCDMRVWVWNLWISITLTLEWFQGIGDDCFSPVIPWTRWICARSFIHSIGELLYRVSRARVRCKMT